MLHLLLMICHRIPPCLPSMYLYDTYIYCKSAETNRYDAIVYLVTAKYI